MFSGVNGLVFLLLFLACMALCLMICRRVSVPCPGDGKGWELVQELFLCGLTALLLTVAVICLWYLAVLLLLAAARYLYCRCPAKRTRQIIVAGTAVLTALVIVAGVQLMMSRNEEDEEDAVVEDVLENGMALLSTEELPIVVRR